MVKSVGFFCVQRISLLLNFLFFIHFVLLYQSGFFIGRTVITDDGESGMQQDAPLNLDIINNSPNGKIAAGVDKSQRIIYLITPTVDRAARKADLTRMAQTVKQVQNLHWIVVEDGDNTCECVANLLHRLIYNYTYLAAKTPDYKSLGLERALNKGIFQRNVALEWVRWRYKDWKSSPSTGVIYFADDDNTYDLRLFDMLRTVDTIGVWPVALVGGVKLEKPVVNSTSGKLIGFQVGFAPNRTFAVDMAGFALGLRLVLSKHKVNFPLDTVQGWNEPALFDATDLTYDDVQVLGLDIKTPDGLLEPLVWHTKTATVNLGEEERFKKNYGKKKSDEGWDV